MDELCGTVPRPSSGKPSIRPITLTGMFCAYCTAASMTVSPGVIVAHLVEQLLAEPPDLRLPRLDHLRRERRQEQPTGDVVERRIAGDRRGAADRGRQRQVAGSSDRPTTARLVKLLGVVGDLVDGVVGQRNPHAAVAIGVGDRAAALAQLLPDLGGVRVVRRIGVVEVGREVGRPGRSRRRRTARAARRRCPRGCSPMMKSRSRRCARR